MSDRIVEVVRNPPYSAFMALALIVFVTARRMPVMHSSLAASASPHRWQITLMGFVGGMFGARIPFLIAPDQLTHGANPGWIADGKTLITGIAGAYVMVEATKWWLGVRSRTGDSYALPLAAALSVGRLGCFFGGCCTGIRTTLPWGIDFGDGVARHPVQLYESLFHGIMACVLYGIYRADQFRSQRLKLYLLSYCVFRFVSEFLRPAPVTLAGLTFYQLASLALAMGLCWHWLQHRTETLRDLDPEVVSD